MKVLLVILLSISTLYAQVVCDASYTYDEVSWNIDATAVMFYSTMTEDNIEHEWWFNGRLIFREANPVINLPTNQFILVRHCVMCYDGCPVDCMQCVESSLFFDEFATYTEENVLAPGTLVLVGNILGQGLRFDYAPIMLKPGELIYKVLR